MAPNIVKSSLSFLCNNSRTSTAQNNSRYERIEGFRIYMKQVDMLNSELASEWTLLYDTNIKDGTYINHSKDTDVEKLVKGNINSNEWDETSTTDARALIVTQIGGD